MKCLYILIILLITAQDSYNQQQFNHSGLRVPTKEMLQKIAIAKPRPAGITALRPAIDLSLMLHMPVPGMQGVTQGSCTAWSIAYGMITYLKARQMNWPVIVNTKLDTKRVYSPSFLYNAINTDPACKLGIYLTEALDFSINTGAISLSKFRYDPQSCSRKPIDEENQLAHSIQLLSYNKIFDAFTTQGTIDIIAVKARLNDSLVVPVGVHLDNSFFMNTFGDRSHDASTPYIWDRFLNDCPLETCYHAMLCVGYNENLQAFKVLNSWDVSFGNGGYAWISYNVFREVVKEAYVATLKPRNARPAALRTFVNTPIKSGQNFFNNLIVDTNWIKKGYYRQYGSLRVGCLDISPGKNSAIVRLTDTTDKVIIATVELKTGEAFEEYEYKGRDIRIKLNRVGQAGRNPFTKAIFYEVNYKNISGENFINETRSIIDK